MATTLDSEIFRDLFGTERMRAVFDSRRLLQGWLDAWAALADAEVGVGIVPAEAAARIRAVARAELYDMDAIREGITQGRHVLFPSVRALSEAAGEEAGGYVHWGATTEDIIDTGLTLQMRDGVALIRQTLVEMIETLARLALEHSATPMAARTHFQHAVPITFGLKVAVWVDQLRRDLDRIDRGTELAMVGHLGGSAGTLAALGDAGEEVEREFCRILDLDVPTAPWYAARDRYAELISAFGMFAATLERIALEIARLQGNDIGEVAEPLTSTQVGSSTMPQKHNPVNSARAAAACKLVRGLVPVMQGLMVIPHERDISATTAEWLLIPQSFILLDGALTLVNRVVSGLTVNTERMRTNLGITRGSIVSEAVMFGLARHLGRMEAHEISMAASRAAAASGRDLIDVLLEEPRVTSRLTEAELRDLVDPEKYLGFSTEITERVGDAALDALGKTR
jgi:3-carboxy-cis,cis-muconate cycloisomerase